MPDAEDDAPALMPLFSHHTAGDTEQTPEPPKPSLPTAEASIPEALSQLSPGQVDPALLAPIHARLVALQTRMGAAG